MRSLARLALLVVFAVPLSAQDASTLPIAFTGVSVVDVRSGAVQAGQTVVITGNRITDAGPSASVRVPAGAQVVAATGKYLIPGLWDMHVHVVAPSLADWAFPLFIANGITGVRDLALSVDGLLRYRRATAAGTVLGPRILGGGVLVDGTPHVYPGITHVTTTPAAARQIVDSLATRGVDFIKAYEMLQPEVFRAVAEQARARRLPLAGHLPLTVSAEEGVRAGMRSFEHLRNIDFACSSKADSLRAVATAMLAAGQDRPGMPLRSSIHSALRPRALETYDEARCLALLALFAKEGTWQTANLVLGLQGVFRHDTTARIQQWLRYLPDSLERSWRRAGGAGRGANDFQVRRAEWTLRLVRAMRDRGVGLLAGTDFPNPVMVPGVSLHEELALFVRAGLTPAEALRTATLNPALFFGMADSLGTIERGKLAELVLLDANPLEDIRHTTRISAVVRGGRYLDRAALDGMLSALERH
jgi:imidazolonepropionase-like amidohydrolase